MSAQRKNDMLPDNMESLPKSGKAPADVAGYIADMVLELRNMAKDHQLEFLAYLLEMSFQEAFDLSQRKKDGDK